MSFLKNLFGSKPKTIDDEIMEAGKAAGYPKEAIIHAMEQAARLQVSKEEVLANYNETVRKNALKKK